MSGRVSVCLPDENLKDISWMKEQGIDKGHFLISAIKAFKEGKFEYEEPEKKLTAKEQRKAERLAKKAKKEAEKKSEPESEAEAEAEDSSVKED